MTGWAVTRHRTVWAAPAGGDPAPYPTLEDALADVRPGPDKHLEPGDVVAVAWPSADPAGDPPLVLTPGCLGHLAWRAAART